MGTRQSQREIAKRPQSIEHGVWCRSAGRIIDWRERDGVRRMVAIIEEAGGSLGAEDLERRMEETGGSEHFGHIHHRASREGLVYMDNWGVFHGPKEYPPLTPEELAEHEAYQEAERIGVVRWSGGKRIVVAGDSCPFTGEELETIRRMIVEGEALVESAEVSRMNRLCLERKVTDGELDACMGEVARRASAALLQEQQRQQASRHAKPAAKRRRTGPKRAAPSAVSKPAPRCAMDTEQSLREIAERPQSIEHGAWCRSAGRIIDWRERDGVRRMVAIIEEAGGSLAAQDLELRMEETGGSEHFGHIHHRASREGLLYMDNWGVFHVPEEYPASTPEERARHDTYLEAERIGVVRWSGGKRIVIVGDSCPFTGEELETIRRHIRAGEAIGSSPEVSRMNRLCLERKVTKAELDACRSEVARRGRDPQLYEQHMARKASR